MASSGLVNSGIDLQLAEPSRGQRVLGGLRLAQVLIHFSRGGLGRFYIRMWDGFPAAFSGTPKCKVILLRSEGLAGCGRRHHVVYVHLVPGVIRGRRN